jgi:hypothetical protein
MIRRSFRTEDTAQFLPFACTLCTLVPSTPTQGPPVSGTTYGGWQAYCSEYGGAASRLMQGIFPGEPGINRSLHYMSPRQGPRLEENRHSRLVLELRRPP